MPIKFTAAPVNRLFVLVHPAKSDKHIKGGFLFICKKGLSLVQHFSGDRFKGGNGFAIGCLSFFREHERLFFCNRARLTTGQHVLATMILATTILAPMLVELTGVAPLPDQVDVGLRTVAYFAGSTCSISTVKG